MKPSRTILTMLALIAAALAPIAAQEEGANPDARVMSRDTLREQIRSRIEQDPTLDAAQRLRMETNLRTCLRLELRDDQIEALFPMGGNAESMAAGDLLRWQERLIEAERSGLAVDLLADKLREGRMKHAQLGAIEGVLERMEQHLRIAQNMMVRAAAGGVTPAVDDATARQLQRGVALDLWRGLPQGDLDRLRERAQDRARDGSCSMIEIAAGAETATELLESGVAAERAGQMAADAIGRGLQAREIREIGQAVRRAVRRGESPGALADWIDGRLRAGEPMEAMVREMMQHGWLGPRDLSGGGGYSPVDNVIGGPGPHGSGASRGGGGTGGGASGPGPR